MLLLLICSPHFSIGQTLLPGIIETKNNTLVKCQIPSNSRKKDRPYEYVETFDSLMGVKKLFPHQIMGYSCEGKRYESIRIRDNKSKKYIYVFAEQITKEKQFYCIPQS